MTARRQTWRRGGCVHGFAQATRRPRCNQSDRWSVASTSRVMWKTAWAITSANWGAWCLKKDRQRTTLLKQAVAASGAKQAGQRPWFCTRPR